MVEGSIQRLASVYVPCHLHQVPSESEARPTRAREPPPFPSGRSARKHGSPMVHDVLAGRAAIYLDGGRWRSWSLQPMVSFCPAAVMRSSREEQVEHTFQLVFVTLCTHS